MFPYVVTDLFLFKLLISLETMWHLGRTRWPSWRLPWWRGIDTMPLSSLQSTISSSKCGTRPQGSFSTAYLWVQFQGGIPNESSSLSDWFEAKLHHHSPVKDFGLKYPAVPCLLGGGCPVGKGADCRILVIAGWQGTLWRLHSCPDFSFLPIPPCLSGAK